MAGVEVSKDEVWLANDQDLHQLAARLDKTDGPQSWLMGIPVFVKQVVPEGQMMLVSKGRDGHVLSVVMYSLPDPA